MTIIVVSIISLVNNVRSETHADAVRLKKTDNGYVRNTQKMGSYFSGILGLYMFALI